ncbi:MAG: T9SS type A sorting domain-containing protein [Thermoanaerobaculia bacterium]|nr:T9SS type A sorting domain-containing protein [Thermoanaerobaculia bacterium]
MKIRLVYLLFLTILCALVLPASKNGRASADKTGNTGAPGDDANPNGTPRTCSYCHFGAAAPTVTVRILDTAGDTVTTYVPGSQYTARVSINTNVPSHTGFGFQMIALRDSGNTDLDGFSDPGNNTVNNYKIATIPNGRTYAEHDNVSVNNSVFNVVWTAPAAGTGPVTFYAAGNAVNRNGSTSGDGTAATTLKLTEQSATSAPDLADAPVQIKVWPNPVGQMARLEMNAVQAGQYRFRVVDVSGKAVWQHAQRLGQGTTLLEVPAADWAPGMYLLEAVSGSARQVVKLVR